MKVTTPIMSLDFANLEAAMNDTDIKKEARKMTSR